MPSLSLRKWGLVPKHTDIALRDSRLMENPHPAQESPQGMLYGHSPESSALRQTPGERGLGARRSTSSAVAEPGGHGRDTRTTRVRRGLAGSLDRLWISRKEFCFRRAPVRAGRAFSFMHKIILGQQPPKQPLAQNKNGKVAQSPQ